MHTHHLINFDYKSHSIPFHFVLKLLFFFSSSFSYACTVRIEFFSILECSENVIAFRFLPQIFDHSNARKEWKIVAFCINFNGTILNFFECEKRFLWNFLWRIAIEESDGEFLPIENWSMIFPKIILHFFAQFKGTTFPHHYASSNKKQLFIYLFLKLLAVTVPLLFVCLVFSASFKTFEMATYAYRSTYMYIK